MSDEMVAGDVADSAGSALQEFHSDQVDRCASHACGVSPACPEPFAYEREEPLPDDVDRFVSHSWGDGDRSALPHICSHPPPPPLAPSPPATKLDRLLRSVANRRPRGPFGPPYRPGVNDALGAVREDCQDPSYPPCELQNHRVRWQAHRDASQDPDYPQLSFPRYGQGRLPPSAENTGSIKVRGGPHDLATLILPGRND